MPRLKAKGEAVYAFKHVGVPALRQSDDAREVFVHRQAGWRVKGVIEKYDRYDLPRAAAVVREAVQVAVLGDGTESSQLATWTSTKCSFEAHSTSSGEASEANEQQGPEQHQAGGASDGAMAGTNG